MDNLIQHSLALKQDADKIIQDTKINEIFSSIGKVVFVGSYILNLLYRRDIDLFVLTDNCSKENADNVTKKLNDSSKFQTIDFANWNTGYYWKLEYIYQNNKWKFDVWYTSEKNIITIEKTKKILNMLQQNPEARKQILKMKQNLYNGGTYKDNMNGFKIYEQVLGKIED